MGFDESYELTIPTTGDITIKSKTVYGAYHGLEVKNSVILDIKSNNSLESIRRRILHRRSSIFYPG